MPASSPMRDLVRFYTLAFLISWAGYLPFFILDSPRSVWLICLVLPAAGPALAVFFSPGPVRPPLRSASLRPAQFLLLFVAALTPPILLLLTKCLVSSKSPAVTLPQFLLILVLDLAANPSEEIGWRGYALPRLQRLTDPVAAALINGTLTALWHLPLFLWPARSSFPLRMSNIPLLPWVAGHLAASILVTLLYNLAARNLLPVILFHLAFNLSTALLGISSYPVLAGLEIVLALCVVILAGRDLGWSPSSADLSP